MSGRAPKVVITERQQDVLLSIVAQRTAPQYLVMRAGMILLAFEGKYNIDIGKEVGVGPDQVGVWRKRWKQAFRRLVSVECTEGIAGLRKAIETLLSDAHRSGCPGKFTAEQVAQIIAVACESPEACGLPITHWSPADLTTEVLKRGIVESISVRQVGRFLKSSRLETAPVAVLAEHN